MIQLIHIHVPSRKATKGKERNQQHAVVRALGDGKSGWCVIRSSLAFNLKLEKSWPRGTYLDNTVYYVKR